MKGLTKEAAQKIWEILVADLGVYNDELRRERDAFIWHQTEDQCMEYRIGGKLGFGGKFRNYNGRWYVDCYPEDIKHKPERQQMIDAANAKLAELHRELSKA